MFNVLEKIEENSKVHKQLLKIIGSQGRWDEVVILENSNTLSEGAISNFRIWLIENKIRHNVVYTVSKLPIDIVKEIVRNADTIAFETTGISPIVGKLRDYIAFLSTQGHYKKIIECYISDPCFGFIPVEAKSSHLKAWILASHSENMNDWNIEQLKKR